MGWFRREHYLLAAIFLFTLGLRLFFAFQTDGFSSDESYFNLRLTEHIANDGFPLIHDDLSYSGRDLLYSPVFYYIIAFFNLFFPIVVVAKVLPNIFASLLVVVVYLISKELTSDKNIALFTSFISAFVPIFLFFTTNSFTVYSLMVPLIFFAIYCLMDIERLKYFFIFAVVFAAFLHPSSILLILGFWFYILVMKLSAQDLKHSDLEAVLFATLLITWSVFLLFKNALLAHGVSVIWQNVPSDVLRVYFSNFNVIDLFYKIGIIPLLCGLYIVFVYTGREKSKDVTILVGFAASTFLLLWLRLLKPEVGLIFLGVSLVILFSQFLKNMFVYVSNSKFSRLSPVFAVVAFLLFIPTMILPSIVYTQDSLAFVPEKGVVDAMVWLRNNSESGSVVLASLDNGHLITYFAGRKDVFDPYFLLVKDINTRVDEVGKIYSSSYETDAIELLNKYNVDYIFLSSLERSDYNIQDLKYNGKRCFQLVYDKDVKIYRSLCELVER